MNSSDSHESVKGSGSAARSAAGYKAVPRGDTAGDAERYLLPHERQFIAVHQHPAVLIRPILVVLLGTAIAGFLSGSFAHGNGIVLLVIWVLWGVLLLWLVVKVLAWAVSYFVVTSQRLIFLQGIIVRQVNMMPLTKVTDMSFDRSMFGRLLGYGDFIIESAGQEQALNNVRFLPYPEQLYLEVCGLIFDDERDARDERDVSVDKAWFAEHVVRGAEGDPDVVDGSVPSAGDGGIAPP